MHMNIMHMYILQTKKSYQYWTLCISNNSEILQIFLKIPKEDSLQQPVTPLKRDITKKGQ